MPGELEQAGLSQATQAPVTASAPLTATPQSTVSAQELTNPMRELGNALGYDSRAIDEMSVPIMQQAGAQAALTRGPDGMPKVADKILPFNTGAGATAYNAALHQGALAAGQNAIAGQGAQMASQFAGDPAGFQKAYNAYVDNLRETSDPVIRPWLVQEAEHIGTTHFDHLVSQSTAAGMSSARDNMLQRAKYLENQLYAVARGAGTTDIPGVQKIMTDLHGVYGELNANPLFGVNQDQAASEQKRIWQTAQTEATIGTTDKAFTTGGAAAVEKIKRGILDDPNTVFSDGERQRLASEVDNRVQYLTGVRRESVAVANETTKGILKAWDSNVPVDDAKVDAHLATLQQLGANEQVAAISMGRLTAPHVQVGSNQPDTKREPVAPPAAGAAGSPSPAVGAAITTAAQRYGLDPALMTKMAQVESRFDPNATNPSGASGVFQMMPKTWAQYGQGANVFDPAANADAAARLLVANRDTLRSGLGREPTPGELYLSHQQGAQGALNLLKNPNASAASVVGSQAVLGNGGTSGMTAGQFATLWTRKFDNPGAAPIAGSNSGPVASGSAPPAALGAPGTLPFTPAQEAANRSLFPAYVQRVLADRDGLIKVGASTADAIETGIKTYDPTQLPSAQTYGLVRDIAQRTGDAGLQTKLTKIDTALTAFDAWRQDQGQGGNEGAALISSAKQLAAGGDLTAQAIMRSYGSFKDAGAARMKSDWINEAVGRGWAPGPAPQLDLSSPDAINQSVAGYGRVLTGIVAQQPTNSAPPLFPPADMAKVKDMLANGTLDQKQALASSIMQLPTPLARAAMGQIAGGSDPDSQVFTVAGSVSRYAPDVGREILAGQMALKANPKFGPKDDGAFESAIAAKMPPNMFGPGGSPQVEAAFRQAALAHYAAQSTRVNDVTGVLDTARLNTALNAVTGGILDSRSSKIIAPWYGASQDDLDGAIRSLTDKDLEGATALNGDSLPAAALKPGMFSRMYYGDWRLQSAGDGKYRLISGPDEAPVAMMNARYDSHDLGGAFILDLGAKGNPSPVQGPPMPPPPGASVMPSWPAQPVGGVTGQ